MPVKLQRPSSLLAEPDAHVDDVILVRVGTDDVVVGKVKLQPGPVKPEPGRDPLRCRALPYQRVLDRPAVPSASVRDAHVHLGPRSKRQSLLRQAVKLLAGGRMPGLNSDEPRRDSEPGPAGQAQAVQLVVVAMRVDCVRAGPGSFQPGDDRSPLPEQLAPRQTDESTNDRPLLAKRSQQSVTPDGHVYSVALDRSSASASACSFAIPAFAHSATNSSLPSTL